MWHTTGHETIRKGPNTSAIWFSLVTTFHCLAWSLLSGQLLRPPGPWVSYVDSSYFPFLSSCCAIPPSEKPPSSWHHLSNSFPSLQDRSSFISPLNFHWGSISQSPRGRQRPPSRRVCCRDTLRDIFILVMTAAFYLILESQTAFFYNSFLPLPRLSMQDKFDHV